MSTVSVTQINPDDEITSAGANLPHNQLAAVINGNLDDDNISSLSGTKIVGGTLPVGAFDTNTNPETRIAESLSDFVASGVTWSSVSGLNGTMTSGAVYILGKRLVIPSVSSRAFTASKDTYVDVGSTGTLSYTEVANGATAPALAANSLRLAKVVTSGSAITSVVTSGRDAVIGGNAIRSTGAVSASDIDLTSLPAAQQAWQTPTLLNSWTNHSASYASAQYMKDSLGFVHIKGLVKGGANGSIIFTLPAGYRPLESQYIGPQSTGGTGYADLVLESTGNLKPFNIGSANVTTYMSLNATFKAEQ